MTYKATVVNVMIASPGDVEAERQTIREVIHSWNDTHAQDKKVVALPLSWESHATPDFGERAQEIINKQVLKECDLLVAVFWTRVGSPTGVAISGTVEEIEKHVAEGKQAMIYFSNAPVRPDSVEEKQYSLLKEFRKQCFSRGLVNTYDSAAQFASVFQRHFTQTMIRNFTTPDVTPPAAPVVPTTSAPISVIQPPMRELPISEQAVTLLLEVASDPNGTLAQLRVLGGLILQTNGKQLAKMGDPRSEALWKDAVQELVRFGLLESRGYKGEIFGITGRGYQMADYLRQSIAK